MSRQSPIPGRGRPMAAGTLGRSEDVIEEDRPFAEIRKSVHDALRILSLHRWACFIPFSVVACSVFVASLYYPRTYRATTSFERRNDPVMMNLPLSNGAASFKYFRDTIVQDLTSVECLEEVVDQLELTDHLERADGGELTERARRERLSLARSLADTLSVSTTSPSEHIDMITVTYTGPNATLGRALVDEVKRTYIRRTMAWIHEFLTGQREYFLQEASEALSEVKSARREETRLRLENPHVDPTNPGAIALKLSQLEMERRELELRHREYAAELTALQQLLAAVEPQSVHESTAALRGDEVPEPRFRSAEALQLSGRLQAMDEQIESLKSSRGMTDRHPEVRDLWDQRKLLAEALADQQKRDSHAAVSNVPLDTAGLGSATISAATAADPIQGERARLMVQIAAQKSKLRDIEISLESNELAAKDLQAAKLKVFQKQEEFAEILGRVAQARQQHAQLQSTLASIEPAINAIEQGRLLQFSEGQPARGSAIPISPKASTIVMLALLAGIAAGAVMVVVAEVFDNVFRSSGQVARALGLPVLEAIDEIITPQDRRYLLVRRVVFAPLVIAFLAVLTGLAGSIAYLSIERPWTYQKFRQIPDAAIRLFAENSGKGTVS